MSNKSLRIILWVMDFIHWFLFGCLICCVIKGKNNPLITIALCLYGLEIFLKIKKIFFKRNKYQDMYLRYLKMFEDLKYIHKVKYGLYFSGNKEKLEKVIQDFEECANDVLQIGEEILENPNFNQEQKEGTQKVIDKTKYLLENVQPPM